MGLWNAILLSVVNSSCELILTLEVSWFVYIFIMMSFWDRYCLQQLSISTIENVAVYFTESVVTFGLS